jgi:hypothetical protein
MTHSAKELAMSLLQGDYLRSRSDLKGKSRMYTLYRGNQNPIRIFTRADYKAIEQFCKIDKIGRIVISIKSIRKAHGKSYVKKLYKQIKKETRTINSNEYI